MSDWMDRWCVNRVDIKTWKKRFSQKISHAGVRTWFGDNLFTLYCCITADLILIGNSSWQEVWMFMNKCMRCLFLYEKHFFWLAEAQLSGIKRWRFKVTLQTCFKTFKYNMLWIWITVWYGQIFVKANTILCYHWKILNIWIISLF